jgi:putative flippase GtrA
MSSEMMARIARFGVAGALATGTSALALHISITVFGMWYLAASVVGFFAGFFVSFTLQKFWTFRDTRLSVIPRQVLMYFTLLVVNLGLNTVLIYSAVEFGGLQPVVAQIGASLLIACQNFFLYRFVIFRTPDTPEVPPALS